MEDGTFSEIEPSFGERINTASKVHQGPCSWRHNLTALAEERRSITRARMTWYHWRWVPYTMFYTGTYLTRDTAPRPKS